MTLSSVESAFSFIKNDGRQLPYEVSSNRISFFFCLAEIGLARTTSGGGSGTKTPSAAGGG